MWSRCICNSLLSKERRQPLRTFRSAVRPSSHAWMRRAWTPAPRGHRSSLRRPLPLRSPLRTDLLTKAARLALLPIHVSLARPLMSLENRLIISNWLPSTLTSLERENISWERQDRRAPRHCLHTVVQGPSTPGRYLTSRRGGWQRHWHQGGTPKPSLVDIGGRSASCYSIRRAPRQLMREKSVETLTRRGCCGCCRALTECCICESSCGVCCGMCGHRAYADSFASLSLWCVESVLLSRASLSGVWSVLHCWHDHP